MEALTLIDIKRETDDVDNYKNVALSMVNDHNVRLSVMTEPYYRHYHPNSDETFIGVEGIVIIELENRIVELGPGQLFNIPANAIHSTRPKGARSVNLTFERIGIETVKVDDSYKAS